MRHIFTKIKNAKYLIAGLMALVLFTMLCTDRISASLTEGQDSGNHVLSGVTIVAAPKTKPKAEPKAETKTTPKAAQKTDTATTPKTTPKAETGTTPKTTPKAETATTPKTAPKAETNTTPNAASKTTPQATSKPESNTIPKTVPDAAEKKTTAVPVIEKTTIEKDMQTGGTVDTTPVVITPTYPYDGSLYPAHPAIGTGVGVYPGRVVWEHNPLSTNWSDMDPFWWKTSHFNASAIQQMVVDGICTLAGDNNAASAWNKLFTYHNLRHGRAGGYLPGQKIAIKMNMNGSGFYNDSAAGDVREDYTNPVFAQQFLISLVRDGGVRPSDIYLYDCGRIFPSYFVSMCNEGILNGINIRHRDLAGPNNAVPNTDAPVNWSVRFNGLPCYYPFVVTDATYLIDFASLKGHTYGITLSAKNHFGSIENSERSRVPLHAGVHDFVQHGAIGKYNPLVDLLGSYQLGEKCFLYVYDAFICAYGESIEVTMDNSKWSQYPFNGYWTSSCFFSQDPVALDSVGADFLTNEPEVINRNNSTKTVKGSEGYLHEAALAFSPPSGTIYTNGAGYQMQSLGTHEHWSNKFEKQYSRNLGKNEGIELVYRGTDEYYSNLLKARN